jgi:glycosyltransferase involved in cell wall biosynthesis
MKLLLSAYACEPGMGSEPGVGWNWVHQAARHGEVWVLTRTSNRATIEDHQGTHPQPNIHFEYLDLPDWARFWKKGRQGIHTYYYLWQTMAASRARKLHKSIGFDCVQHVTFVNSWMPSFVWTSGAPFIWGPIGTNPTVPEAFLERWTPTERAENQLRRAITWSAPRIRPDVMATAEHAQHIVCGSQYVQGLLPERFRTKSSVIWQNGIHESEIVHASTTSRDPNTPLRVIAVGRLIAIKGMDRVLQGFAAADLADGATLTVVGDGPWKERLDGLANELSIEDQTRFTGTLPRDQVLDELRTSDVLLFPSFEGAGMVVMEAMASGLPVVCLDAGGPGEYVTQETGIKVPVISPSQVVDDLGAALRTLAHDEDARKRLSDAALVRAQQAFLWRHRGDALKTLYDNIKGT